MKPSLKSIILIIAILVGAFPSVAQDFQTLEKRVSILEKELEGIKAIIAGQPSDMSNSNLSTNPSLIDDKKIVVQDGIKAYVDSATCFLNKDFMLPDKYIVSVTIVFENQTDSDIPFAYMSPKAVDNFGTPISCISNWKSPSTLYPGVKTSVTYYGGCPQRASSFAIINLKLLLHEDKYKPIRFRNIPIKWE